MFLNIIGIIAIIVGPVSAVIITLWHQDRKQKIGEKNRLFLTLMAHRKTLPPNPEWVNALNVIDVVFSDNPNIVTHWHDFYNLLHADMEKTQQQRDHKYLELLSAMAKVLDYPSLSQTDIDKFYIPKAYGDQYEISAKIQKEWLRVLENSARFVVAELTDNQKSSQ
jgi:hypothetical protein